MRIEVVMPKMGESLQEGTITKWLKKEGEAVERDEMILEISTDKVDTEVPSPNAGVLAKILVQENETVAVGTTIAYIETEPGSQAGTSEPQAAEAEAPAQEAPAQPAPADNPVAQAEELIKPDESAKGADLNSVSGSTVEVVMPKMGESLQEGTITKWLKKQGEEVERDEMILEISTDKVDTEVPSPVAGILAEILVGENETVAVGTVIAKISVGSAIPGQVLPSEAAETFDAQKQVQSAYGTPGEGIQKESKQEEPIAQQSAGQSTMEGMTSSPIEGTKEIPRRYEDKFFSPLVRKIAEENGIFLEELTSIKGSGVEGRVTKNDLEEYIKNRPARAAAPAREQALPQPKTVPPVQPAATAAPQQPRPLAAQGQAAQPSPAASSPDVEVIPMDRVRRLIAEHMVYSKQTSPHVTSVAEADVTAIVRFREKHKEEFQEREGFKLTYTPFFAQAAAEALRALPMVNVSVDGTNILRHKRINLAIATALPDGNLIVPVIKSAESLNFTGFARAINDLATRARTKKLNPDDIQGGTFTLTNVGTFGTLFGMPIINQPQTGIMGLGAIEKRPVVREMDGDDVVVVRSMVYVSLTYDHRVIDGMLAGKWLAELVRRLESMNETNIVL
ncbi:MAG: 2-oxoglutarate dehydrogenase, E2 component, dihydrolipoamide succinyltransferase [Chloroflexota bacterium]